MNKSKNNRTTFLALILVGLLILAYKVMFVGTDDLDLSAEENTAASVRVENMLLQVEKINFDTSVMRDPKFQSLKSIETPLISLPIGKSNPFLKNFGSN